ncbi:MAG: late competence development ComFB family protein [Okeania sp. SIO3B5]|uniref:late competence development ComFB family protein n=1 Tax=Okeania sp. SIO3B5 TaxID=2607811 RepID=UPI0013FE80A8|nr:late competence development ComFB family protein [Okeania sp. SIO3B5]NEO58530.1 late competence development ComFB family protein [Okeania sp. SIO3B5]
MSKSLLTSTFRNAMECLIILEIEKQLKKLPREIVDSINKADVTAYSLNRLPPMYFTTQKGKIWQQRRSQKIADMISRVVSLGIKAAQRNNKIFSTPLHPSFKDNKAIIDRQKSILHEFNAMIPLATVEIERQLKRLPNDLLRSINKVDVIAYTLNRLPPLYSTTREGWIWQQELAREKLITMISRMVTLGIKAVQKNTRMFVQS